MRRVPGTWGVNTLEGGCGQYCRIGLLGWYTEQAKHQENTRKFGWKSSPEGKSQRVHGGGNSRHKPSEHPQISYPGVLLEEFGGKKLLRNMELL